MDAATGKLLQDADGKYIAAGETVYSGTDAEGNLVYYTQNTTGYNNGTGLTEITTGLEETRVYNNGKVYISEQQYKELAKNGKVDGIDGVEENYRVVTIEPKNELTEIPSQYVVDENGEFLKLFLI